MKRPGMNEDDQFLWVVREMTLDLDLSDTQLQEFADILKAASAEMDLSASELRGEVEKLMSPEPEEPDEADWWKE